MSDDSAEVWWIYAPERHPWGGLRVAYFIGLEGNSTVVMIQGEPQGRAGPRVWDDIAPREGWVKVRQIPYPSRAEIDLAVDAALHGIARQITKDVFETGRREP